MANIEIYIHIPFCVRKCGYCDFLSAPGTEEQREAYVQALIREIGSAMSPARLLTVARAAERTGLEQESLEQTARGLLRALEDSEVSSVYIGGGTPSILTGEQIWRIMTAVKKTFRMADDCEITMEVNPATVDIQKLSRCRFAGINRVSIGLQSADDKDLAMLGRVHTVEDFEETFRMVREAGFKNVSVDLIHSLPGQTVESWEKSLRFVAHLGPEHISAYSLIIEEGTPFYNKYFYNLKKHIESLNY